MQYKTCTKCGRTLPATIEHFRQQKAGKYGFRATCRDCCKEYDAQYRQTDGYAQATVRYRTSEKYAETTFRYHRTEDYRERERQRDRREYDRVRYRNPQRWQNLQDGRRRRYKIHRERYLGYSKAWYQRVHTTEDFKLKARARAANRRALLLQADGTHTRDDITMQYEAQKGSCWWCGCKLNGKYHIDHRVPLSRGGSNAPSNLCLTCATCNLSKNDRLPHEWSDRLL